MGYRLFDHLCKEKLEKRYDDLEIIYGWWWAMRGIATARTRWWASLNHFPLYGEKGAGVAVQVVLCCHSHVLPPTRATVDKAGSKPGT